MDLSAITVRYKEERRGGAPYHPRMMLKVLLYGYCTGVASSRRIGQRPHGDIVFRVLAANNTPDGCPALAGIDLWGRTAEEQGAWLPRTRRDLA